MRTLYRASLVRTFSLLDEGAWVLVDERHVERVGIGDPPAADRVVDLPGATILPGFVDAHVHLSGTGLVMDGLDLSEVRSRDEALARAREHHEARSGPVLGMGFDETRWTSPDLPTLADLDAISREPVLLVRADGYVSLANWPAIDTYQVEGLEGVERDAGGRPTGALRGDANARAQLRYFESLPDETIRDAQRRATELAASRGVTCVHEMAIPDKRGRRDVEVLLRQAGELPVDVVTYVADREIPYVIDLGQPRIGGDLFLDGSIGARTAALKGPDEGEEQSGTLAYSDDELAELLHNAHLAGLQSGLHVIGDAAIEQALRAWERVYRSLDSRGRRHFRARRHRLEHFEMASVGQVERAGALGLAISIQPMFDALWGGEGQMYEQRLGPGRAWGMNPFRSLLERGIEVGGGSDSPVTPLDPVLGVWALENHHDPVQRLGRDAALRVHTTGGARIAHLEKKGRLEPGSAADFAAYESDPMTVEDIREVQPILTVSRGREVASR